MGAPLVLFVLPLTWKYLAVGTKKSATVGTAIAT
jgi:hypothetical protein